MIDIFNSATPFSTPELLEQLCFSTELKHRIVGTIRCFNGVNNGGFLLK